MHKTSGNNPKFDKRVLERLEQSVRSIKAVYKEDLLEICVFGSYSKGKEHRYSSIDILVIIEETKQRFLHRNAELEKILNEDDRVPQIDPLVYTDEEIIEMIHKRESFVISMVSESIVIWHKAGQIDLAGINTPNIIRSKYSNATPELKELEY
jgi:predicted nucleotidyltransferase